MNKKFLLSLSLLSITTFFYPKTNFKEPLTQKIYSEQTTQTENIRFQEVSIIPQDEIKDLMLDERKYKRNKWGCIVTSGVSFAAMGILIALESGGHIQDMVKITTTTAVIGLMSGGTALGNWWAERRSHRQAQALAYEYNIIINEPGYRIKDDTINLEINIQKGKK